MKKLLSLFGVLGIGASGSSFVVSCGNDSSEHKDPNEGAENESLDAMIERYKELQKRSDELSEIVHGKEVQSHREDDEWLKNNKDVQEDLIVGVDLEVLNYLICQKDGGIDKLKEIGVSEWEIYDSKEKLEKQLNYTVNETGASDETKEYTRKLIEKYCK
ncbi:hypothetical protein SCORR_v1c10380 (plasmid) [Spiroplasma corruscae]|uniref:Lipoprotein n=1 Tax=Spiroplasma corruscae TaxID=216934 RepID=A0A222EQL3_9MOLU|nr:lipoprotein [Spiroplasma corruscae]ASP28810.1 hypothetical protein SCORR_v1c10380 [Spiroplasma corruscae]